MKTDEDDMLKLKCENKYIVRSDVQRDVPFSVFHLKRYRMPSPTSNEKSYKRKK